MGAKHRILLVEDEAKLSKIIREELNANGYDTDIAADGLEASKLFNQHAYALVLLDINLPYKNGFVLCREFRDQNKKVPIIMLSAAGEIHDKVEAFNIGADDYIVKPFHFVELFARVKVFLKRSELPAQKDKIFVEDMEINFLNKTVTRAGVNIPLTAKEFTLLSLLAKNRDRVISKQEILEKVWDLSFDTGTNTIEVYISFLRNKIDKPFSHKLIHTKPGFGYYIK
ncbi:MAG: response regulator transcription factor [Chitinophagaceae bacterium]|nr:response regulator transcription factor [Chitinophagaceae bacterium]MEA3426259.1 response regulator transcription factor [Bacteroidota bacterium]MCA6453245.1 response regulator transcription factor [Chitinophagaceae bacterium]MCA6456584.1 response regulator transcription factor [Chitinophagaceae bacterium]MCA6457846.1 response regulator transcription factor [Chitinophagaceae bacterium]